MHRTVSPDVTGVEFAAEPTSVSNGASCRLHDARVVHTCDGLTPHCRNCRSPVAAAGQVSVKLPALTAALPEEDWR